VQIRYTSYQPIVISAVASVDVELTVSINLGLFSIHIHFGFSATVKATFELRVTSKAEPWKLGPPAGPASLLNGPPQLRLFSNSQTPARHHDHPGVERPARRHGSALAPCPGRQVHADAHATGDAARAMADQQACYVALLLMDAPAPVGAGQPATGHGRQHLRAAVPAGGRVGRRVGAERQPALRWPRCGRGR
jgi:hypothetical protein